MKIPFALLITLLCGVNFIEASLQDRQEIFERVRRYIEEKEPAWKLDRKEDLNDGQVFHWKSDKQRATISIETFSSEEESRTHLLKNVTRVPVPYQSKINDLGDEAFLYQSKGSDACSLLIRKGTAYIQVNADECASAEQFAKHIIA